MSKYSLFKVYPIELKAACNKGLIFNSGVVSVTLEEYSDSNWDIEITVSGNDVRASVTGLAATTVNWKCSMQFIEQ